MVFINMFRLILGILLCIFVNAMLMLRGIWFSFYDNKILSETI